MVTYRASNARRPSLICLLCFAVLVSVRLTAQVAADQILLASPQLLLSPPEARSPIGLTAINDPDTGKSAFSFNGREDPPVVRAVPGEDSRLTYVDSISTDSHERSIDGPCMNMTNLHFHGLHVSPDAPQGDVITMMATPGRSLHYVVNIPLDQ